MPKMDMRLPRSIYSACGPFTKTDKEYKNSIRIGETYKAWFQHDMAYGEFKEKPRGTIISLEVLLYKAIVIASNQQHDLYYKKSCLNGSYLFGK